MSDKPLDCVGVDMSVGKHDFKKSRDTLFDLERRVMPGRTIPVTCEMTGALTKATNAGIELVKEYERLLEVANEALNSISVKRYPEELFGSLTQDDWDAIQRFCEDRGFTLDRLSAEYGRLFTSNYNEIAQQALKEMEE